MHWFPLGPDFVFGPRRAAFARLSRRNERGHQGLVSCIAIEPRDSNTIYVCVRPSTGGSSVFLTRDGGESWVAISDALRTASPSADPKYIAIHPDHPETIYVGSYEDRAVYISYDRGASWSNANKVCQGREEGGVLKIIVDPRPDPETGSTVLYAIATEKFTDLGGLYRSADGGVTWSRELNVEPTSLVAHMPLDGTAHFYVGAQPVWSARAGVYHTTDPRGTWENLCDRGIGLPRHDPNTLEGNYSSPLVDFCPRAPERVYAWFARSDGTTGLYTTSSSIAGWTRVIATRIPNPQSGYYCYQFAVAPNSPGDGLDDILLFGNVGVHRSIDAGRNWKMDAVGFHEDIQAFAFFPSIPAVGEIPTTYLGCDGGLASSVKFADRAVTVETPLTDFNQGAGYSAMLPGWINLNHGRASNAVMGYASDPNFSAVSFIGCQDTGVAASEKALGWRSLGYADVYTIAVARGAQGVSCWLEHGLFGDWPGFRLTRFSERRSGLVPSGILFGDSRVANTANIAVGADGKMITGMVVRDGLRTVAAAFASGVQTVTPSNMAGIAIGSRVVVEPGVVRPDGTRPEDVVTVTDFTDTSFTAAFRFAHPARSRLQLEHAFVGRLGEDDPPQQISQDFGDNGRQVTLAIVDPTNANILFCATYIGPPVWSTRVWTTNTATAAGPATVWTEIAINRPVAGRTELSWIAVDAAGTPYALWTRPIPATPGGTETPLYRLSEGGWIAETVVGTLPPSLAKFVADPLRPGVLYIAGGGTVYRLDKTGTAWSSTDISADLPRDLVYDLWIANIGTTASPKVLLRAAVTTRGVFEADVTAGAVDLPIALYLRDHFLDQGWLTPSPEGMPDPYKPSESGETLWHYMCADIKVDTQTAGIFQTDPEGATPLSHVHFDMLRDNSKNLAQSGTAKVHVMVHNRSHTPATDVWVWAIYCRASAGVPGLNVSASMANRFPFWNQFRISGLIEPNLPADSPWTSVGMPIKLQGIDADHPRVATFDWTIPMLTMGDTGHYCIVVFLNTAKSVIFNELPTSTESRMNVDLITTLNRQIGQKNLQVIVGSGGNTGGVGGGTGARSAPAIAPFNASEYVEFHNPTGAVREASLRFDLRGLAPDARATLRLTPHKTRHPPGESITGVASSVTLSGSVDQSRGSRRSVGETVGDVRRAWQPPRRRRRALWAALRRLCGRLCCRPDHEVKEAHRLPKFEPIIHELKPSAEVVVHDVVFAPFERVGALLELEGESLGRGERIIHVQQIVDGQVAGGSVYTIGMADEQTPEPVIVDDHGLDIDPSKLRQLEEEAEKWRYVPPWIKDVREEREVELGKKDPRKRREPIEEDDDDHKSSSR